MKTLEFTVTHHLSKLHDELLEQFASEWIEEREEGNISLHYISGDGEKLTLRVPDETDEAIIQSIIDAHDPTPPPLPADPDDELIEAVQSANSLSQLKAAIVSDVERRRQAKRTNVLSRKTSNQ